MKMFTATGILAFTGILATVAMSAPIVDGNVGIHLPGGPRKGPCGLECNGIQPTSGPVVAPIMNPYRGPEAPPDSATTGLVIPVLTTIIPEHTPGHAIIVFDTTDFMVTPTQDSSSTGSAIPVKTTITSESVWVRKPRNDTWWPTPGPRISWHPTPSFTAPDLTTITPTPQPYPTDDLVIPVLITLTNPSSWPQDPEVTPQPSTSEELVTPVLITLTNPSSWPQDPEVTPTPQPSPSEELVTPVLITLTNPSFWPQDSEVTPQPTLKPSFTTVVVRSESVLSSDIGGITESGYNGIGLKPLETIVRRG